MKKLLSQDIKIVKVKDHSGAGTSPIASDGVDLSADGGWDGVLFLTSFGTAAANNLLKAQVSSDNGGDDDYSDLAGSALAPGASDEDQWLDIYQPPKSWVKVVATPGTSSTVESIWAFLYRGRRLPISNVTAGTIIGKAVIQAAEGTP